MSSARETLARAWGRRAELLRSSEAARVFHGPGEARDPGSEELAQLAIEKFGDHYWVYEWEKDLPVRLQGEVTEFLTERGARSIVLLERPRPGPEGKVIPAPSPRILHGEPPAHFDAKEGPLRFRIRFQKTRHPGLFLDHRPLREWLIREARGRNGLNTFSYTGSLSAAAGHGGASRMTTLDLSKPTIAWARENWEMNGLAADAGDFIYGDYFDWLPRLAKRGDRYDFVILDPPSFSRGKKGSKKESFSTARDLPELHAHALRVLAPGGLLVTSINSANVTHEFYRREIEKAARDERRRLKEIKPLGAPAESFPGADYLKGWIFEVI